MPRCKYQQVGFMGTILKPGPTDFFFFFLLILNKDFIHFISIYSPHS